MMELDKPTTTAPPHAYTTPSLPNTVTPPVSTSVWRRGTDRLVRYSMALITLIVCLLLVFMVGALLYRSWPLLRDHALTELLFSTVWNPGRGAFGLGSFIIGSMAVTLVATIFAVIPAIFSGIYLAEYMSLRTRSYVKPTLDLLVGIPSVVYGLWGILFVVPLVREYIGPWSNNSLGQWFPLWQQTNSSGYGLLAAGFVLGVMVFPLVTAVTEEVMRATPRETREAALCLGATRWEATKLVIRRQALGGIIAAGVLGLSRAFGETLAVMMLIGNTTRTPTSLFDTAYSLPGLIANNYGEMMSVPLYESALMLAALVLLVIVLLFNILARLVIIRVQK
jgi:phosphate transport system permease protein